MSMNIYEYVGDEKQEYSTATNISKEEYDVLKIAPKNVQQQPQINHNSIARCGNPVQAQDNDLKHDLRRRTKYFIVMAVILLAVTLIISFVAIVLSVISYNASSDRAGLRTQEANEIQITKMYCGAGVWHRVAFLNMSDPSQQCPPSWREYNTHQFRACGRPISNRASRPSHIYPTNHQYSKVCGRIIGIQVASPDAFLSSRRIGIDGSYMDGVSITYGSPRNHIWTYVGSFSETATGDRACPCDSSGGNQPQPFVGNNYYCESGNPGQNWQGQDFPNDKLWDGQQCSHEGTCCTGANTPPWFNVSLRNPTSDDIEVRICGNERTTNEDTPIELLEIYVQ